LARSPPSIGRGSKRCASASTISSRPGYRFAIAALDRDDAPSAQRQQCARQAAWARSDLDDGGVFERAGAAGDPRREIEVEQKILTQRFARRQSVFANDVAQRRQIVDRGHVGRAAAMRAASRSAAARLDGLALPVPAMSKAVP
jgi:hypothetical protein